jgi:hypothetical protein
MSKELQTTLDGIAEAAQALGAALPGPGGVVAKIVGIAVSSAAAFARAGKDPLVEIQRIHSSDPLVRKVHDGWDEAIQHKFGVLDVGDDPYEEDKT